MWNMEVRTEEEKKPNMADIVEIISTCSITMESHDSYGISRLELTPWDLQLLLVDPIQKGVLFYKPQLPTLRHEFETTFIDHLKTSLSRALDFFPPLAGRLAMTKNDVDNTTLFHVECNNAGAHFAHAKAHGVYVRDILNSIHTPSYVRDFFPLNGISNLDGLTEPLLGVQVTELVDGFFVAGTMSHCVIDGTSFWHFFNSWSEISCGSDKITKLPSFERNIPGIFPENLPIPIPSIELKRIHNKFSPPPMLERVFHFSRENLSKLKARANFEARTDNISSFQALLAHIWRSVQRCRVADQDLEVICFLLIGTRARLALPAGYFGNAIHVATVHTKIHDLVNEGIGSTALAINNVISIQTKEEAMNVLEDLVEDPLILEKQGILLKNGFLISSSPRHTVYDTDFGWGKPVAVRSGPAQKNDGKITLFPGTELGGIDVEVCLAPETLIAMGDDAEFMEAVTF